MARVWQSGQPDPALGYVVLFAEAKGGLDSYLIPRAICDFPVPCATHDVRSSILVRLWPALNRKDLVVA